MARLIGRIFRTILGSLKLRAVAGKQFASTRTKKDSLKKTWGMIKTTGTFAMARTLLGILTTDRFLLNDKKLFLNYETIQLKKMVSQLGMSLNEFIWMLKKRHTNEGCHGTLNC